MGSAPTFRALRNRLAETSWKEASTDRGINEEVAHGDPKGPPNVMEPLREVI